MRLAITLRRAVAGVFLSVLASGVASAADYPAPARGEFTARDFRFQGGQVLPALRLSYLTIGAPTGEPVLVLHGTAGSAQSMLTPAFAGALFGPGQPLDAQKYFIIIPDALGAGESAKPSDGMRAGFPAYDYDDMVAAQHRLVTEGLGLRHLRLVLGNSMGGMHAWLWGIAHPEMMDGLVPMASQPIPMSGRNWMMRRMIIDAVRQDPAWQGGNYTTQPPALKVANAFFGIATSGGSIAWQAQAPTRQAADQQLAARLAAPFTQDANDFLYQWDSSRDFDPTAGLPRISAPVLAINAADDERNPPETGLMEQALARIPRATLYMIPASAETRGHGTTGIARFWTAPLAAFLASLPKRQP
ncbi:alpha/beta fold hydrolase [Roseomonas sp. 18066]|uniref:alpha/beta fold hydrolase n=1 Tax=Roseomonas sp. 18066 TaxID=2681412 RepID=UPI001358D5CB|nr:alpha/beta fold hydrolase [Roseomonas sp. 18066]